MRTFVIEGTVTSEQPLATCSKDLRDIEGVDLKPTPVPSTTIGKGQRLMFPGSGLRATLRRAARDVVRKRVISLTGNAKPFSLDQHYFLTLGGIKGAGKQERGGVAMMAACRAANPLISMFGAGDAGVAGVCRRQSLNRQCDLQGILRGGSYSLAPAPMICIATNRKLPS